MDRSLRQLVLFFMFLEGMHYKASNTSKSTIKTQEYGTFNNQLMMDKNIKNSGFFQNLGFFSNSAHVIYLLTTITGSNKMNKMALMIKEVLSVFCFILSL